MLSLFIKLILLFISFVSVWEIVRFKFVLEIVVLLLDMCLNGWNMVFWFWVLMSGLVFLIINWFILLWYCMVNVMLLCLVNLRVLEIKLIKICCRCCLLLDIYWGKCWGKLVVNINFLERVCCWNILISCFNKGCNWIFLWWIDNWFVLILDIFNIFLIKLFRYFLLCFMVCKGFFVCLGILLLLESNCV